MDIPKVHLTDVCLYLRNMHDIFQKSDVVLTCIIKNYSRLEENKIYYQYTSSHDRRWTIKIVLKQGILFVFLSTTPLYKKVQFRILLEGKKLEQQTEVTMTEADEVSPHQLFVSEFCNRDILDPKNEYLRDDKLIIQCKYEENELEVVSLDTYYNNIMVFENHRHEVSKNMLDLYKTGFYSDFSIKVADTMFWVHKVLLAARSKYFADLFTSNHTIKSKTLTGTPNSIHEVLIYMYSGELRAMTTSDMVEVLRLSNELQIVGLKRKCLNFYETYLSPYTLIDILKLFKEHNLQDLKDIANKYVADKKDFILSTRDAALAKRR